MSSQTPTVRYHTIVNINAIQTLDDKSTQNLAVNNVVKVMNGTIESVLHLIGYSFLQIKQINRELAVKYNAEQNQEFDLSYTERQICRITNNDIMNARPSRAHVIQYGDHLYGVIVDRGVARICGQIYHVIPKTLDTNSVFARGVKICPKSGKVEELSHNEDVRKHIDSGHHIVIVSENGSLFVVSNDDTTGGHQLEAKLGLVLGHGFVIIECSVDPPVDWIRSKPRLRDERRESTPLSRNESLIVSNAAISVGADGAHIYGTGCLVSIKTIKEFYDFS